MLYRCNRHTSFQHIMSSWAKNVSFNDTVVNQMTTQPATTVAPTLAPTTQPASTAAPSYPANDGFGGGGTGVVFPLPVAPSLLLGGDIEALNPLTPIPTTTSAPETLAPIPTTMPVMLPEEPEEEKPAWTWTKVVFLVFAVLLILGAVYYFFIHNKAGKNGKNGKNGAAAVNNSNNLNNMNNMNNANNNLNYNNSALNDYNNSNSFANNPVNLRKK